MLKASVVSSNIEKVGFDRDKLYIQFKSGITYEYDGVSDAVFFALSKAESAGQFFHRFIRSKYVFRKVNGQILAQQ